MSKLTIPNLYLNRFLGDFVPVMPIMGLLLLEREFSISDISLFFLALSVAVLLFEIPGGLLADRVGHRFVLILSRLFKLLAFLVLYFSFSIPALVLAAVLWGIASAFDSGAVQAYTYELLREEAGENKKDFATIYGRMFSASLAGLLVAGLVATLVNYLGFSSIQIIGIMALFLCVVSSWCLPALKTKPTTKIIETEKTGLFKKMHWSRTLIILLVVGVFAGGVKGTLDEYSALILDYKDFTAGTIALILFGLEVLRTAGAAVAARFKLNLSRQILVLAFMGLAFIAVAVGSKLVAVVSLVAVLFIDAILWVHNDVAIQNNVDDKNRATTASLKNFGTEIISTILFSLMWFFGDTVSLETVYKLGGVILVLVAVVIFILPSSQYPAHRA